MRMKMKTSMRTARMRVVTASGVTQRLRRFDLDLARKREHFLKGEWTTIAKQSRMGSRGNPSRSDYDPSCSLE